MHRVPTCRCAQAAIRRAALAVALAAASSGARAADAAPSSIAVDILLDAGVPFGSADVPGHVEGPSPVAAVQLAAAVHLRPSLAIEAGVTGQGVDYRQTAAPVPPYVTERGGRLGVIAGFAGVRLERDVGIVQPWMSAGAETGVASYDPIYRTTFGDVSASRWILAPYVSAGVDVALNAILGVGGWTRWFAASADLSPYTAGSVRVGGFAAGARLRLRVAGGS